RTPVAVGSSVPVCPHRLTLKRPLTLRTTSNEVGPLGLLTTTTPEGSDMPERLGHFARDERPHVLRISVDRAPGGVAVAAAAELARDVRDVDVSPRAEAHVPRDPAVGRLGEAAGHLHTVHGARVVDESVGEIEMRPGPLDHLAGDGDGGEPAALIELEGG